MAAFKKQPFISNKSNLFAFLDLYGLTAFAVLLHLNPKVTLGKSGANKAAMDNIKGQGGTPIIEIRLRSFL